MPDPRPAKCRPVASEYILNARPRLIPLPRVTSWNGECAASTRLSCGGRPAQDAGLLLVQIAESGSDSAALGNLAVRRPRRLHRTSRPRGSSTGRARACPAWRCRFESGPRGPGRRRPAESGPSCGAAQFAHLSAPSLATGSKDRESAYAGLADSLSRVPRVKRRRYRSAPAPCVRRRAAAPDPRRGTATLRTRGG